MAQRPVFISDPNISSLVRVENVTFTWHAGMSIQQKQRSIDDLHREAKRALGISALEVSSKSREALGVALSAFNLTFQMQSRQPLSVECAFQGSKVFARGGPYRDLFSKSARDAKRDERLQNSGELIRFDFEGFEWPLEPKTVFYDWLYITALRRRGQLDGLRNYQGFTDIEFNPEKSFNCQARSVALYRSLETLGVLDDVIASPEHFLEFNASRNAPKAAKAPVQGELF